VNAVEGGGVQYCYEAERGSTTMKQRVLRGLSCSGKWRSILLMQAECILPPGRARTSNPGT